MSPATLHGVGVINKLYFVIIAAFIKESVTLNLAQRAFKVIHLTAIESRVQFYTGRL